MRVVIPQEVQTIIEKLTAKHQVFLVGGALRDLLLEKEIKDWDFTTDATPEQMLELLPGAFYDNRFGTVGVATESHGVVEITTFRSEQGYSNNRHPDQVVWGTSIEEDLQRRDFTINAMALPVMANTTKPPSVILNEAERSEESSKVGESSKGEDASQAQHDTLGEDSSQAQNDMLMGDSSRTQHNTLLIDPYNGKDDVKRKVIRAVGDPNERFEEDALRMLRAVRFSAQLSFTIEEKTLQAIQDNSALISNVSGERIRDEVFKILASDFPYDGFMVLRNTGLLSEIFPELEQGFGVEQLGPNRHHIYDVGTHNFLALKTTPAKDPLVRFATLLHDVGKPMVVGRDNRDNTTFYNHEVVGAKIARDIAFRLHLSKIQREKLVTLVRWHQFSVDEMQTDSAVRRFIRNIGIENIQDMIDLRIGDRLGSGIPEHRSESWRLKLFKDRIEKELNPPFSIKDMVINGYDIMKELGLNPGPEVGRILESLFQEVDEDLAKNEREYLIKRVHEISKEIAASQ